MSDTKVTSAGADNTGATIRNVLVWLAGMLLSRQLISEEFYQQFMSGIPFIIGLLLLILPWAQSYWAKWRSRMKTEQAVNVALALPSTATKADVVAEIAKQPDLPMVPPITGSGKQALPILMALALAGVLSAGIVVTSGCGSFGGGDKPVTVDASISRENAKRALIELQDARTLLLKSMAVVYMASPDDPAVIERVRAVDRYDTQFRQAWQLAALAVDRWDVSLFAARYAEARDNIELMKGQVNP